LVPIKYSLANAASSPFVQPLMRSPLTLGRRSWLRSWVLRGSLKEPEGGERKGGGKGLGARLAKRAMPVSNRKGSWGNAGMVRSASWGSILVLWLLSLWPLPNVVEGADVEVAKRGRSWRRDGKRRHGEGRNKDDGAAEGSSQRSRDCQVDGK
jgi:hypothetical protein